MANIRRVLTAGVVWQQYVSTDIFERGQRILDCCKQQQIEAGSMVGENNSIDDEHRKMRRRMKLQKRKS